MKKLNAFVSVIIPVYNAEKYLKECLDSIVVSSAFCDIEVLLIDDGSVDKSGEICDDFSRKYENIRVFHIENGGVSNARNVGISHAKGEYITFCDADDFYVNDIFEKAVATLKSSKSDLLFYDFLYDQPSGVIKVSCPFSKIQEEPLDIFKLMLSSELMNSCWNKFYSSSVIKNNDISFTVGQKYGEDRDFVLKFLSVCKSTFYLTEEGYFYRFVESSAVNKSRTDYFDNLCEELMFKQKISTKFDVSREEVKQRLGAFAKRQIISCAFAAAENKFSAFSVSLKKLFKNEYLMSFLMSESEIVFDNSAYKKLQKLLRARKIFNCWLYIKSLELKEFIYKLLH